MTTAPIAVSVQLAFLILAPGAATVPAAVATSAWQAAAQPVYCDPDDNWAKDPSVIRAGDTYYMYYTSANPWQEAGAGGQGEPRIDYATSPDGLVWTRQGVAIARGWPGAWDDVRPQAPAKPILKDGVYYMYYAGAGRSVTTGFATSTDLRHWTKQPGDPVLGRGKVNDPFVYVEEGRYYLFFTAEGDRVYYVTSADLIHWSSPPVFTGAVGEGSIVLKEGTTYTILACVGWSPKGEYYKAYTAPSLTARFTDRGRIRINVPAFASGSLSHGDILRHGAEYWFYFQGTRDVGKTFQIGLARQPVPAVTAN